MDMVLAKLDKKTQRLARLNASRASLRECVRACARACVGTHPDASASGCGAFALLGCGAPVATLLHLRWGLAHLHWLATELDARWLRLW